LIVNLAKIRERRFTVLEDLHVTARTQHESMRLAEKSDFNANSWLRECYQQIRPFVQKGAAGAGDEQLALIASGLADKWAFPVGAVEGHGDAAIDHLTEKAREFLNYLKLPFPGGKTPFTRLLRLTNKKWWRKQISTALPRIVDQTARKFGAVNKKREIYLSNAAFNLWQSRQFAAKKYLETTRAKNSQGQVFTLSELAGSSVTNPHIKRTELMVRMRGLEEYAQSIGYEKALFVTITAPSKYHSHNQRGIQYANWNFTSPRAVNDYLNGVWSRIRADLDRQEVGYFGVRVAEPHHDGCPHWHLLIFARRFDALEVCATIKEHALAVDGAERGASSRRCVIKWINPGRGSAVGYIAKYLSKNIDGHGIEKDLYDQNSKNSALRIRAWASTWGIRQFQFFGLATIGPWRELRRVRRTAPDVYEGARVAADNAEFADYLREYVKTGLRLFKQPWFNVDTGETLSPECDLNGYGELMPVPVRGVVVPGYAPLISRLLNWTVLPSALASAARNASEAWTCVTNCTEGFNFEPGIVERSYQNLADLAREALPVTDEFEYWQGSGLKNRYPYEKYRSWYE
jgi:hypothetical protein